MAEDGVFDADGFKDKLYDVIKNGKEYSTKDLETELERDTEITIRNLREKSMAATSIWSKWNKHLSNEKEQLKRLAAIRQEYFAKKNAGRTQDAFSKIKSAATVDERLRAMDELKTRIELRVEFITRALEIISGMSYHITNTINILKMENC